MPEYGPIISCSSLRISSELIEHGCQSRYDIAEYLNISEEFLQDAINYYKDKYGAYIAYDNYFIYFEPLGVLKIY